MRQKNQIPCFTIQTLSTTGLSSYGTFRRRRDAERYMEDNGWTQNSIIRPTNAGAVTDWGADCPQCKTRATRDRENQHKPESNTDTRLSWVCPACNHHFAD